MSDSIRELIDERITREFQILNGLEEVDENKTVNRIETLHKLRMQELEYEAELAKEAERRAIESEQHNQDGLLKEKQIDLEAEDRNRKMDIEQEQIKLEKKGKMIDTCVHVGIAVASIVAYNHWFKGGLRFEETGSYTSPMVKGLFNRMLPKL